jgi:hypothetical protein
MSLPGFKIGRAIDGTRWCSSTRSGGGSIGGACSAPSTTIPPDGSNAARRLSACRGRDGPGQHSSAACLAKDRQDARRSAAGQPRARPGRFGVAWCVAAGSGSIGGTPSRRIASRSRRRPTTIGWGSAWRGLTADPAVNLRDRLATPSRAKYTCDGRASGRSDVGGAWRNQLIHVGHTRPCHEARPARQPPISPRRAAAAVNLVGLSARLLAAKGIGPTWRVAGPVPRDEEVTRHARHGCLPDPPH